MGLLAHLVVLFSIFWGISILFSIVVAPFYIPTNHVQGFWFLNILANQVFWYSFIVVLVWNVYNFSWAQNVIYISLIADDFDHVFRSLLAFEASSSANWLLIPCYHISNGAAVCFFVIDLHDFIVYFGYQSLCVLILAMRSALQLQVLPQDVARESQKQKMTVWLETE